MDLTFVTIHAILLQENRLIGMEIVYLHALLLLIKEQKTTLSIVMLVHQDLSFILMARVSQTAHHLGSQGQ